MHQSFFRRGSLGEERGHWRRELRRIGKCMWRGLMGIRTISKYCARSLELILRGLDHNVLMSATCGCGENIIIKGHKERRRSEERRVGKERRNQVWRRRV